MQKETEVSMGTVLQTIARMEHELQMLRVQVAKLAAQQTHKRNGRRKAKSLYGILPPINLSMEDYRAVRRSGTPRSLRHA